MARHKRSRNKGYWFRDGRGWFVTDGKSAIPLRDDEGNCIKSADDGEAAKQAYARYLTTAPVTTPPSGVTVKEVCEVYLHSIETDHPETYAMRAGVLFDLCTGYPASWRTKKVKPPAKARIHSGYGDKPAMSLTHADLKQWTKAHTGWKSPRAALQAIRRALNYGKESQLIDANPVRGLKVPKVGKRVAYLSEETEAAVYRFASPALALAVKVCIRVGARPEIEFASLEARHVEETKQGQRWRFPANESKGGRKARTIYVPEEIAEIVRKQKGKGPVFCDDRGKPWTRRALQAAFRRLKGRLTKMGCPPEEPFIPYTCRHSFAKRMLGGYWGAPVTLEILAGLMGNSPKVCWEHYAQWSDQYVEPFWAAIGSSSPRASVESVAGV